MRGDIAISIDKQIQCSYIEPGLHKARQLFVFSFSPMDRVYMALWSWLKREVAPEFMMLVSEYPGN